MLTCMIIRRQALKQQLLHATDSELPALCAVLVRGDMQLPLPRGSGRVHDHVLIKVPAEDWRRLALCAPSRRPQH